MPEPESITSIELQIPCGERAPLGATLTLPAKPRACALILQGSGPHDRDGAMPAFGFRSTLYKRLAHELGKRFGIACLRYDKRGHDLPADAPRDYSLYERIDDARFAFVSLKSQPRVSGLPQFIVGHSEGGLLAGCVAVPLGQDQTASQWRSKAGLMGVISLAAPYDNVFETNLSRARKLSMSALPGQAEKGKAAVEFFEWLDQMLEKIVETDERVTPDQFRQAASKYLDRGFSGWESPDWYFCHRLGMASPELNDPTKVSLPMLVIQGGRDARLPEDNPQKWEHWSEERKLASYLLIPDMGHDLNDARRKAFVLDETLLNGIGSWVKQILNG